MAQTFIPGAWIAKLARAGRLGLNSAEAARVLSKADDAARGAGAANKADDTAGGTVHVDTSRATRGTSEYDMLNSPPANTRIELDNGTTFRTNEAGYVDEISYQPVNQAGVRDGRQTAVGREGISGDVGGHIQACRHGGTCDRFNLFPQTSNFNSGPYRRWENEITRALQSGDDVGNLRVRFNRVDPQKPRPLSLEVEYSINGETRIREFRNQAGGDSVSNPIEEQRQIIDKLYWIVKGSCPESITSAKCRFDYDHGYDDGSDSVGSAFSYLNGLDEHFPALDLNLRRSVIDLIPQLHAAMKAHTGGDWDAFTLFINQDGSVTTKFEYPEDQSNIS